MAAEFIGYNVLLSLRSPPDGKVHGQVAGVNGHNLILKDVTFSWSDQRLSHFSIDASAIIDLVLEAKPPPSMQPTAPVKNMKDDGNRINPPQNFADPAILSFSKTPSLLSQPPPKPQPMAPGSTQTNAPVAASLMEPFSHIDLNKYANETGAQEITQDKELPDTQRVPSKMPKPKKRGNTQETLRKHAATASTNPKSEGWRQTAFVETTVPATQNSPEDSPQTGTKLRKKTRQSYARDPSGWATEDATDIQELGDFDFQSNLSKFDKRRVFEEIRNDDTTADEARLVSFNRKAKPGTNGGKNLHWTENVLDSPQNSDAADDVEISDARHSSENISGRSAARVQDRKGSGVMAQPMVPQISAIGRNQYVSRTTSPRPGRSSVSPMVGPNAPGGSLRLTTTNRSCPTVSPLQALEVEQIAVAEFGLSEDIITENAGRGIAEAAVALLSSEAAAPTILIITGNHRTGARAISAARHLRNRGHRVTLSLLGLEHEVELLENCRKQLEVFRKIGGRVLKWEELSARLSTSDLSPDLVIDALFGMHLAFDDLRMDDQGVAFEMISWVNLSSLDVLSVDIPSGVSASTGDVTAADGGQLCVNASSVVCLGAPKTGILNALLSGHGAQWRVSVADIGIPQIVWRKYGTRRRHGIDFGNRWVVPIRYQAPIA
ncbi:hypothetical protein N7492_010490 [Penicillium capsulatum]|uniref:NAD(P)H-hydrate epimerase n=1 Tax=Penicillium capsulatum TaxID=69766 RepID=A0A9W9LFH6_9EURO|nr:hypothetical protein N7492_010490 [Penicillium capsulatum]KAJ6112992.1 hypothetical protein N7512_008316 [Penicillium capsulatum]